MSRVATPNIDYTDEALNDDTQIPHTVYENLTHTKPTAVERAYTTLSTNE